ncbi:MAG TPA: CDGSH iron-sulfur domain-containing protein [Alphaproteobacteria bacterium]|nr:CDGSH iron-sulfur domain-containing protein [Alphaproteobacteria bacterium]
MTSIQQLEENKTYYWCTCGLSAKAPFCDGSHKGSDKKSLPFSVEKSGDFALCDCTKTKNQPFCDGSHSQKACCGKCHD